MKYPKLSLFQLLKLFYWELTRQDKKVLRYYTCWHSLIRLLNKNKDLQHFYQADLFTWLVQTKQDASMKSVLRYMNLFQEAGFVGELKEGCWCVLYSIPESLTIKQCKEWK